MSKAPCEQVTQVFPLLGSKDISDDQPQQNLDPGCTHSHFVCRSARRSASQLGRPAPGEVPQTKAGQWLFSMQ